MNFRHAYREVCCDKIPQTGTPDAPNINLLAIDQLQVGQQLDYHHTATPTYLTI